MKQRDLELAGRFGIEDKVRKLEQDLLAVKGVVEVEYDLNGFLDSMNQVIFLTKYDIPVSLENYFSTRQEMLKNILEVAKKNGLSRTGDRIEDHGEHFYFVMECDESWRIKMDKLHCITLYKKLQDKSTYNLPCPRCGKHNMRKQMVDNCLSRHQDVYICTPCGNEEAMMDLFKTKLPLEQWFAVKMWQGEPTPYVRNTDEETPYYVLTTSTFCKVTDQDIDDIMVTAMEGGINAWCCRAEVVGKYLGKYASDQISRGGELILHDSESDETYTLTLDKFLRGLAMYVADSMASFTYKGRIDPGEIDADGADAIIQYALFGELVYG